MQKKVFIKTFGCQMNEYDSGKMADLLEAEENYIRTDNPEEADLILLNTCSVREKAQEKVFSDLGRFRKLGKNRSNLIIGVSGCVASQEGEALIKRAPYVNLVFGPQTLHRLPKMLHAFEKTGEAQIDISFPEIEKFDYLPPARVEAPVAYVSIMEGCSKYCLLYTSVLPGLLTPFSGAGHARQPVFPRHPAGCSTPCPEAGPVKRPCPGLPSETSKAGIRNGLSQRRYRRF